MAIQNSVMYKMRIIIRMTADGKVAEPNHCNLPRSPHNLRTITLVKCQPASTILLSISFSVGILFK